MHSIRLRQLHRHYQRGARRIDALAGVDLEFAPGSLTAVVGRSGCGKTTLLRHIAGLEQANSGTLDFTGPAHAPRIGLVFQEPRLLPWKTVRENLALAVRDRPLHEREPAIAAALAQVQLSDCAASLPATLSGGMAQRVALARALVRAPDVLLLDEPFSALDALTRGLLHAEFAQIRRERPMTTVLVTHDIAEAVLLADRVIHLDAGRIQGDWPIDLPHPRRPGDARVAACHADILAAVLAPATPAVSLLKDAS